VVPWSSVRINGSDMAILQRFDSLHRALQISQNALEGMFILPL